MTNSPTPTSRRPVLVVALSILGILLVVVAVLYLTKTASTLPTFFPGHEAGSVHKHTKHGLAALILGLVCFIGAWFSLGSRTTRD